MNIRWRYIRSRPAVLALLVLTGASCLYHLWALDLVVPGTFSDLLPRIVGARDALQGMNPYSAAVLRDIQTAQYGHPLSRNSQESPQGFDYPALLVPLLAPFARFSWPAIRAGFLWLMVPAFGLGCWLWLRMVRPAASVLTAVAVVGLWLFTWPTIFGFRMQQPTMVVFVLLAVAAFSLRRNWEWITGVCFAVAPIKPQLSLPLLLWLVVWAVRHRRWQFPASFAISFSTLWLITDWKVPHWFGNWAGSLRAYDSLVTPVAEMMLGRSQGLTVTLILGAWSIWLLWGMLDSSSESAGFSRAVALALAASVLVTPMTVFFIYDQVLLLPAILLILFAESRSRITAVARIVTVAVLAWNYVAVLISAGIEVFHPKAGIAYLLPFVDQVLPIVVLISLLLIAEEGGWSKCGLRGYFGRAKRSLRAAAGEQGM